MIRGTTLRQAGLIVLAAAPLALQIAAEARQAPPGAADPRSPEYFETRVRPVLAANCYDCHADERMGGLRVDSREALLKGGRSGPVIVPGDPDKSLLIEAVRQTRATLKMPKGGRLTAAEVDALVEWVKAGAPWPAFAAGSTATSNSPSASAGKPSAFAPTATASASADKPAAAASADNPTAAVPSAPGYVIT